MHFAPNHGAMGEIGMVNPRLWSFNPSKLRVLLDYVWKNLCCKEKVQLRAKAIKVTRVMQGIVHAPETLTEREKERPWEKR